jgi:hypothetical protein
MWENIEHNGFEIWVLPVPAYGPASPGTHWHYTAYICRHGADAHLVSQSTRFFEMVQPFMTEEEARDAGYREGERLVDELSGKRGQ